MVLARLTCTDEEEEALVDDPKGTSRLLLVDKDEWMPCI